MHAIEFQTTINNGMIEVPKPYLHQLASHVKVIILMEEPSQKAGLLQQLLQTPVSIQSFTPLTREEIYER